jgi:hypothetical protein
MDREIDLIPVLANLAITIEIKRILVWFEVLDFVPDSNPIPIQENLAPLVR